MEGSYLCEEFLCLYVHVVGRKEAKETQEMVEVLAGERWGVSVCHMW